MLLLLACTGGPDAASAPEPLDLTERLDVGAVRAGVVTDAAALFGGVSAEGRPGDVKIYNDRVQLVIQQPGDSSFYVEYGGNVIDADLVREPGAPGRDPLDELAVMVGLGRLVDAESVTVVADGRDGEAVVRVEGPAAPMHLVTGALESPGIVEDLDLWVTTDYALAPESWSLRVTTTVENRTGAPQSLSIGDVGIVSLDVGETVQPGSGLEGSDAGALDWTAIAGRKNELALAVLGDEGPLEQGTIARVLGALAQTISGFSATQEVPAGGTMSFTRWVGVGPDPAALSGEQVRRWNQPAQRLAGVVQAGGAPVPGARVWVLDAAGDPLTVAFADAEGRYEAVVPAGPVQVRATGRGHALHVDLPPGHGSPSPYEADPTLALASLRDGGPVIPFAEGHGLGEPSSRWDVVELPERGTVRLTVADGGPAVATLWFAAGDPVDADRRLVPGRPSGAAALGFVRDGQLDLSVEPGDYTLVVRRGVREELSVQSVRVEAGGTVEVTAELPVAYTPAGVVTGDPHSHGSPSADGGIPMEDRLVVTAANGIDAHFGTDHDHVADYRPLLAPLGLGGRLASVVADEVSPVMTGHFNTWPVEVGDGPNGGAFPWWFGYADTEEVFTRIREMAGMDAVIQVNHPVGSSGMVSAAEYGDGEVGRPERWSDDFQAMEVVNAGEWEEYFPVWLDLVAHGFAVTPVGVSDSHSHTGGEVGLSLTFFHTGGDTDPEALRLATLAGETVASRGPYVEARVDGEWAPGRRFPGARAVDVAVWSASWIPVEVVELWRGEALVATEPCSGKAPLRCQLSLPVEPGAPYVVVARSLAATTTWAFPGALPWAATGAFRVE